MPNFVEFDEMPNSTLGLAELNVSLDRQIPDSEDLAPASRRELIKQLHLDNPHFVLSENDLHFVQTAKIATKLYWLWQFKANSQNYFASICKRKNGDIGFSYQQNYGNWTPDQYLMGEYHDFFYDHWRQLYVVRYPMGHPAFAELEKHINNNSST